MARTSPSSTKRPTARSVAGLVALVAFAGVALAGCGGGGSAPVMPPLAGPAVADVVDKTTHSAISDEIYITPAAGAFDATPYFNAAVSTVCQAQYPSRTIRFGAGFYDFRTAPGPMPCAVNLFGDGAATNLAREYSTASPDEPFLAWTRGLDASGGSIRDMTVLADVGSNGGVAIAVIATRDPPINFDTNTNSLNRHSFIASNVRVGRAAYNNTSWDVALKLDGSANPSPAKCEGANNVPTPLQGTDPDCTAPGIRAPRIIAMQVSGTRQHSVVLDYARDVQIDVGCYIPIGNSRADIWVIDHSAGVLQQSRACEMNAGDATVTTLVKTTFTTVVP